MTHSPSFQIPIPPMYINPINIKAKMDNTNALMIFSSSMIYTPLIAALLSSEIFCVLDIIGCFDIVHRDSVMMGD